MSSVPLATGRAFPGPSANAGGAWAVALAGFLVIFGPVYWWAANGIWQTDEHGHGALVLIIVAWLFWSLRAPLRAAPCEPKPIAGWTLFAFGLVLYTLGRAFEISILELGAQPFVVAGAMLLLKGPAALRIAWFPILYMLFMVPLPETFVDAVTGSLKHSISTIVERLLFSLGYPISQTGVILAIGQYQLMVADACSGLNSMFSLSALGTLFMYVMRRTGIVHNAIMLASILPIAFLANIVRVTALVLITYHLGDEAGQGFLHGAAGIVLMIVALAIFMALDFVLNKALPSSARR